MKTVINPPATAWERYIQRPQIQVDQLHDEVTQIMNRVKLQGDQALLDYTRTWDGANITKIQVSLAEIQSAMNVVSAALKSAIEMAYDNIWRFHESQKRTHARINTSIGVTCWQKDIPIDTVGLYIPGGSAPLFSTILMLGIPAKIAGCTQVVLCTPPQKDGTIHPAILYTAQRVGITKIYKVGGAQAIAAMTYGTTTLPPVHKIFGPGNQYVTYAKTQAQQLGVAIDMPAGPSELLVIADESCHPEFVASDLLSQAEHGPDSQVILVTNSREIQQQCLVQLEAQLAQLPRKNMAQQALTHSKSIVFDTINDCIAFSNTYAPEHLIIATQNAVEDAQKVRHAGSVFIGNYSCESAGDYASGTNHTLPTHGYAKSYSGICLQSFMKTISFQEISAQGLQHIGPAIEIMAAAESLDAHKNAVSIRLNTLKTTP